MTHLSLTVLERERERRVRPDGARRYRRTEGAFGYYVYLPLLEVGYVLRWKYAPGEEIRRHTTAIGREAGAFPQDGRWASCVSR
ncbi:hypothetical protein [Actinoallomurus iriomotensis]|uniref:hypothetical protein n=1 Tax=Actinoallomurus iriomotensis TaxID=478107 RepID=UPI0025543CF2|nr:hypothetical protein [Actinoallomurus iriomotensis]